MKVAKRERPRRPVSYDPRAEAPAATTNGTRDMCMRAWGQTFNLPHGCRAMDSTEDFRNVVEVDIPPGVSLSALELRQRQSQAMLLFDLVTSNRLVIRKPCSFSCSQLCSELLMYAKRHRLCSCNYYVSGTFTWFRCKGHIICPDFCVSEKASAERSLAQAHEQQSRALEGVDILVALQSYDTDEDAALGVRWLASMTDAAAIGVVVWSSTVFVAYFGEQDSGLRVEKLLKPRFVDTTSFVPRLPGMRLYPSHAAFTSWKDELFRPEVLNLTTEELRSGLMECIGSGEMETAAEMVFLLDTLNFTDSVSGMTPLLLALEQPERDTAFVKLLVDNGADPNFKATNGMWPYLLASCRGMNEVLDVLVGGNCKHTLRDLFTNDLEVLRLLLSLKQVPLNEQCDGDVLLIDAMNRPNCLERVKLLLEAGADPTLRDRDGENALSFAAVEKEDDLDVLRVVAEACRELNTIDMEERPGFSILGIACYYQSPEVCSVLLDCGASPDVPYNGSDRGHNLRTCLKMLFALADMPLPATLASSISLEFKHGG